LIVESTGDLSGVDTQPRYDPPIRMSKAEQSLWRRNERKLRNRASAAASRQKQRDRIAELEIIVAELRSRLAVYEPHEPAVSAVAVRSEMTAAPAKFNNLPAAIGRTGSTTTQPPASVAVISKSQSKSLSQSNITPLPLSSTEPAQLFRTVVSHNF
jgi:hypothetical protein